MEKNKISTEETKKNWEPTCNRFVAFLDIMGFKDMVMRKSHEEVYDILNGFSKVADLAGSNEYWKQVHITRFSDSIVVFSKDDGSDSLQAMVYIVRLMFAESMLRGIPLKGALSYGKMSVNKSSSIFFGQPLIDAYLLEEDVCYYGVICHNSFDKRLRELKLEDFMINKVEVFFNVKTPLKSGLINHLNLDWYDDVDAFTSTNNSLEQILEKISLDVSGAPRRYVDNTADVYKRFEDIRNAKRKI